MLQGVLYVFCLELEVREVSRSLVDWGQRVPHGVPVPLEIPWGAITKVALYRISINGTLNKDLITSSLSVSFKLLEQSYSLLKSNFTLRCLFKLVIGDSCDY